LISASRHAERGSWNAASNLSAEAPMIPDNPQRGLLGVSSGSQCREQYAARRWSARATSARCRSAACRLFLSVMLCRPRKRQSELRLVRIRRLHNSATVSSKVRSGCPAIRAGTWLANSSSGEVLPPRGFDAALYRRAHAHLETFCRFASRCPRLYCFNNVFPQVTRIGLRHRQPP